MQILTKIWRKSESILSFSYESAVSVTEVTNLWSIKAMRRDDRFLSLHEFCLKSNAHCAFN